MSLESAAPVVLSRYPSWLRGDLQFLGNHGGFSGAHLWQLQTATGKCCLKAWPPGWRSPRDLEWIHGLMERTSGFSWMPRIVRTLAGTSFVSLDGRLWELTTWMPGRADFVQSPSTARLEAACAALAQLHQAWQWIEFGECPAIERRWHAWQSWQQLLQTGWRPVGTPLDPYWALAEKLWHLVQTDHNMMNRLTPWRDRLVALQPCVCDIWHDHVLYTGDTVAGIIDFGSVKIDHVSVDLARLLGSMVADNAALWQHGLSTYQQTRWLSAEEMALARDLDRTGTVIAAVNWLRWLYEEHRHFKRADLVCGRLASLIQRLQFSCER